MNKGTNMEDAIVLECGSDASGTRMIYDMISKVHGGSDESWFIISEKDLQNKVSKKTFRVVYFELPDETKHTMWFDITNWRTVK